MRDNHAVGHCIEEAKFSEGPPAYNEVSSPHCIDFQGETYSTVQGLWIHKQVCSTMQPPIYKVERQHVTNH